MDDDLGINVPEYVPLRSITLKLPEGLIEIIEAKGKAVNEQNPELGGKHWWVRQVLERHLAHPSKKPQKKTPPRGPKIFHDGQTLSQVIEGVLSLDAGLQFNTLAERIEAQTGKKPPSRSLKAALNISDKFFKGASDDGWYVQTTPEVNA